MTAAFQAGEPVALDSADTIATVLRLRRWERRSPVCEGKYRPDPDSAGRRADRRISGYVENHKMIVENSGLLTVAALKQLDLKGKKAVAVLSGGNMDIITMSSVVQHGLIQRDRIFSVSVLLPDKPGELVRTAKTVQMPRATLSSWSTTSLSAPTGMRR